MKKINSLVISLVSILLVGCGGNGSNTLPINDIQTGTFVDAPVKGLHYTSDTQDDFTNDKGEFKYKAGEKITFKLGHLTLGTVTAVDLITPYTIAGDANISNPSIKATNIALLLQNFDGNRSNTNILDVSKFKNSGDFDLSYINLDSTTNSIENEISSLLATSEFQQYVDDKNLTLINASIAMGAMKTFVKAEKPKKFNSSIELNQTQTMVIAIGDTEDKKITWNSDLEVKSLKIIQGGAKLADIGYRDIEEKELMLYAYSNAKQGNISTIILQFAVEEPNTNEIIIIKKLLKIYHGVV